MSSRTEHDVLGKKKVPSDAFYGIHTQRSLENFPISGKTLPLELFYAITEIKIAAAQANYTLKLLTSQQKNAIVKAGQEVLKGELDEHFVVDAFQAGAGTATHMNVNEVLANKALTILNNKKGNYKKIHPNDHVNRGQSTNNVIPSALKIVAVKRLQNLLLVLQEFKKTLHKKSSEFKRVLKSGRTHLQDAVPITLGQEFKAYATGIEENIRRINAVLEQLQYMNIGKNAIGTGVNTSPRFTKLVLKELKKITKLSWKEAKDPIYATQNLRVFLETSHVLDELTIDVHKISQDLQLLSSGPTTGFHEINLPAVEPGSSIMPGKINPSMAEMMSMVCYQVMGNNSAIERATQAGQLELNVMTPVIAKNLIESLHILETGIEIFNKKCVKGIKANKEVCDFYFKHSLGRATLLTPYLGYDETAELVKESVKKNVPVYDLVLQKKLLDKKTLDKIFHQRNFR